MKILVLSLVSLFLFSHYSLAKKIVSKNIIKECLSAYGVATVEKKSEGSMTLSFSGNRTDVNYGEFQVSKDLINQDMAQVNSGEALVYFAILMSDPALMSDMLGEPELSPEELAELQNDPLFINAQMSFDLNLVRSVKVYESIDPNQGSNPIGKFAVVEAYDEKQKLLGSFISGLLVAECK